VVELVQAGLFDHRPVEVGDPLHQTRVVRIVEQVPVQRAVVVPLRALPDLAAHEQQLLARLRPLTREQQAQVGELLPPVARHLGQQ